MNITFTTRCNNNGITFYSNTFNDIACYTYYDEQGKIHSTNMSGTNIKEKNAFPWYIILFDIILMLLSFRSNNSDVLTTALFFSFFVSFKYAKILSIKYTSSSKFNAANHMVINAYENLEKIPSLNEAKKFSKFYINCIYNNLLKDFALWSLLCLLTILLRSKYFILYCVLSLIIILYFEIAHKTGKLIHLQELITNEPTDKEIILAIEALKNYKQMEKNLKKVINMTNWLVIVSSD